MTQCVCHVVYLHNLPKLLVQLHLSTSPMSEKTTHILISAGILALPGCLAWATDSLSTLLAQPDSASRLSAKRSFVEQGYAYVPLVWGSTLAFYLKPLLVEAGCILQVKLWLEVIAAKCCTFLLAYVNSCDIVAYALSSSKLVRVM